MTEISNTTKNNIPPVLQELLDSIDVVDFQEKVHQEYRRLKRERDALQAKLNENGNDIQIQAQIKDLEEKMKSSLYCVQKKHYLITVIEEIQEVAKKHNWDLCRMNGSIFFYNGERWEEFDDNSLENFLGEAALKMGVEKYDAQFYTFRGELVKQFLSMVYLPEPELKDDEVNINLRNGTFNITRGEVDMKGFDKNDFLMYQLGFDFDPDAKAPLFQKYLDKVLPDKGCQDILSEYIGYIFLPSMKLEKALILYGSGANGKSVFFEVMSALVGKENITNNSLSSLTDRTGYYRAKIANKLLNYASEINGKMDTAFFKQMVSGEPVEARLPHKAPFKMTRYARFIFNCNELPKQVEITDAYFRRFLIIPFEVTIPPEEQDKELANKIIADELSGVFRWVLQGLQRLQKNGRFTRSEKIDEQIASYRKQSDSVLLFLDDEGYEKSPDKHMKVKDLYKEYAEYCTDYGYMKLSRKNMKERLNKGKIQVNRLNVGYVAYVTKDKPKEGDQCKLVLNKATEAMPI